MVPRVLEPIAVVLISFASTNFCHEFDHDRNYNAEIKVSKPRDPADPGLDFSNRSKIDKHLGSAAAEVPVKF